MAKKPSKPMKFMQGAKSTGADQSKIKRAPSSPNLTKSTKKIVF